jgi:glycosyltransferase involved in cell wall biosynthesis
MRTLIKRLDGYRRWAMHELAMFQHRRMVQRKQAVFRQWLSQLNGDPPEVLVGPNFAEFGGVRHHIEAITRYSKATLQLFPPPEVASELTPYDVCSVFGEQLMTFQARGVRAVHSHVFPWFIEWCHRRQQDGIKWIHTYHLNYYPEHSCDAKLNEMQRQINDALLNTAAKADTRICVSRWQVEELRTQHGIETEYLPNGVDLALSRLASASRFRKRFHENHEFILYVGRDDPVKNPGEFVQLAQKLPHLNFVMIGRGLDRETLEQTYQLQAPSNLALIGGVSQQSVQDAIAACRVLVVTSKREGLPTLVMEGMALGKSIVVPNEAGCMEAIGGGEAGLIYQLGNIEDLAEKTLAALHGPECIEGALRRVEREYDWRIVIPKLDAIYSAS